MTKSAFDSSYDFSKDNFALTVVALNEGKGIVVLEMLGEDDEIISYCLGGANTDFEITVIPSLEEFKRLINPNICYTSTDQITKADLEKIGLWDQLKQIHPHFKINYTDRYFFKCALKILTRLLPNRSLTNDPTLTPSNVIFKWNPFSVLFESKAFPNARVRRGSFGKRLTDLFEILNGNDYSDDRLGVLDYVYPLPRLLSYFVGTNNIISGGLYFLLSIPKYIASSIMTFMLTPVVAIVDLGFTLAKRGEDVSMKNIRVQALDEKGNIKASDTTTLGTYLMLGKKLEIEPSNDVVVSEVTASNFYVFDKDNPNPIGLISIDEENKAGIEVMLQNNFFKIDNNLEHAGAMDEVLRKLDISPH